MPTNILVTGCAGFIGSNFVRYLLKKYPNYQVINLDLLTYAGNLENPKDVEKNPNYRFVKGDIADKDLVNDLVKDIDIIVNLLSDFFSLPKFPANLGITGSITAYALTIDRKNVSFEVSLMNRGNSKRLPDG